MNRSTEFLRLNAVTRSDRNAAMEGARDSIMKNGGWITDIRLFSNASECISFEIPSSGIHGLHESLRTASLVLLAESEATLARTMKLEASREFKASLQIRFIHDEPDLKIEVPAVPG